MTRSFVTLLSRALAISCSIALISGVGLAPRVACAQEQRELAGADNDKIDAVLLLDTSGSMLATDPQALRYEGAKLFLNLLRPGDRVAVVAFDQSARVISPFVSHEDAAATKTLEDSVSQLPAQGQFTDLLSGVEAARDLLKKERRPDANAIIVLLSDGKMDPDPGIGTAAFRSEQLLNSVLPELKASSVKVNTLYFSDQADKQLLTEVALASEGASAFASSVDVIHKSFADLFLAVKKPQVVPLTGRGFSIDNDVQEATFYLNRAPEQELVLTSPSGTEIRSNSSDENIKWFVGQRFDVVTVVSPEPGPWRVQGLASSDGFATVLTNLKLVSDWPNSVTAGEPTLLQVRLNEGDKPVVLPEVSTNTRYGVQVIPTDKVSEPILEEPLFDDGTHGDKIAGDGIFSHKIAIEEPGEYRMWLVAKGPTFDRRQQLPFRVKPPLIQIVVEKVAEHEASAAHGAAEHETHAAADHNDHEATDTTAAHHDSDAASEHGESAAPVASEEQPAPVEHAADEVQIYVRLSTEALGFKNIRVSMLAIDEARKRYLIPVEKGHEATEYEVPMKAFPHDGTYELEATIKAEAKKRGEIEVESRPIKVGIVRGVDAPPITALEVGEVVPPSPSPWPYASGVFLINGATAGLMFLLLKRQQSSGSIALPTFAPPTAANEFIALLEQRLMLTEIDLTDPLLQGAPPSVSAAVSAAKEAPTQPAAPEPVAVPESAPPPEPPPPETPPEST